MTEYICKCGYRSLFKIHCCPICGGRTARYYLKATWRWIIDRRFCLVSKRQKIDRKLDRHHLMTPNCQGFYRIWCVYRLFDVIPIWIGQEPTSIFIFDPPPEQKLPQKNSNSTDNTGMMS